MGGCGRWAWLTPHQLQVGEEAEVVGGEEGVGLGTQLKESVCTREGLPTQQMEPALGQPTAVPG